MLTNSETSHSGKILVLIVTFNDEDYIGSCVESLVACDLAEELSIVVLDNSSSDRTTNIVSKFEQVDLIRSAKNLGFAAGNNHAFHKTYDSSSHEWVFLMNADAVAHSDTIAELVSFMKKNTSYGVAGPYQFRPGCAVMNEWTLGIIRHRSFRYVDKYVKQSTALERTSIVTQVPYVQGGAFLTRAALFQGMNGFDSSYWMYHEEVDFCRRIYTQQGLKSGLVVKASIEHASRNGSIFRAAPSYFRLRNRYKFVLSDRDLSGRQKIGIASRLWIHDVYRCWQNPRFALVLPAVSGWVIVALIESAFGRLRRPRG